MQVEHQAWNPQSILIEHTLGDDLCIASLLYPDDYVEYDLPLLMGLRAEVTWIIAEMMGIAPSSDQCSNTEA